MFSLFAVYRQMYTTRPPTHLEMKIKQDLKKKKKNLILCGFQMVTHVGSHTTDRLSFTTGDICTNVQ